MGFKAILKVNLRRGLSAFGDDGEMSDSEHQNTTGIHEATVCVRSGTVNIDYSEPDGGSVRISFPKEDPGIVTLTQKFSGCRDRLSLVFEQGKRHICINTNDGDNMEITTDCRLLENSILKNGKLKLTYFSEIHGFRVEKVNMRCELRKLPSGLQ